MNNIRIHSLWWTAVPLNHIIKCHLTIVKVVYGESMAACVRLFTCWSRSRKRPHCGYTRETARSCWLWRHADNVGELMLFLLATFIVVVKRLLVCVSSDLDYRLPLHNCLSCTVVTNLFLLFSRGVFFTTLFIILSILFTPSRCFLYQTFVFGFSIMAR